MIHGTGELDLQRLIAALPPGVPLSVEAPTLDLAGRPFNSVAQVLGEATRRLLATTS